MIDIVLVNSPIHDYSNYPKFPTSYSTPVGLLYLATVLRKNNFKVQIIDAEFNQFTPLEIANIINEKKPRYVGFNLFTVNFKLVESITALIDKSVNIIVGGPHVSAMPLTHFKNHFKKAKFFIKNEGEYKLLDILSGKKISNIPQIYYRDKEELLETKMDNIDILLDELPIPDRSLLETEPYLKDGKRYVDITISRGCIYSCSFCAGSCKNNGTKYKRRSIESIKNEIFYLIKKYEIEGIQIVDDLPFCLTSELEIFLDFIEQQKLKIEWEINFPLAFLRNLDPKDFQRISKNRIRWISVGIESGSEDIRRLIGKNFSENELIEIMRELFDNSISVKGYFILGFPSEKKNK